MSHVEPPLTQLTDGSKARIQLRADFINGLAMNVQAVGTLGFLAALFFTDSIPKEKLFLGTALAMICFFGGFGLHLWASLTLKELDE